MARNPIYDGTHQIPVDSGSRKANSGGTSYDSRKKIVQRHWESPPDTIPVPRRTRDLTGVTFGRFTVVGLLPIKKNGKNLLWLVRCVCSHYESRRSKSIRNPKNNHDRCEHCRQLSYLKKVDEFQRTGKNSTDDLM